MKISLFRKHFEKAGDRFFDSGTTALVPIDGTDKYYTPEDADNFDEVFGKNTGYVIDPEECLAYASDLVSFCSSIFSISFKKQKVRKR